MSSLSSLAKDTAIYGLSSIVGRFLNYWLVPLYTAVLPAAGGGYGVVSNVYGFTALMLVLLTFGMETGFFRFANRQDECPEHVYANSLLFVGALSLAAAVLCFAGLRPLAEALEYGAHPEYVAMMVAVVALDAFQCIPFAYLRYRKRPMKFAAIKLFNIGFSIALNLFFLLLCPWLLQHAPGTVDWFFDPDDLVGYIFLSNLICSALQMVFFVPELRGFAYRWDWALQRRMVRYCFPLLVLGVIGVLNMTIDKMIYPHLYDDPAEGFRQLGLYSAGCKVAMVIAMFTQAFRYAYEPFVFGKAAERDNRATYAGAMKYFFIFALLSYLAVIGYLDILQYLIAPAYRESLAVVGVVMLAEVFKGIYMNLSFWYKLTDETRYGAYFSLIGCALILGLNVWLVPRYGYMASAWASVAGYGVITLLSYVIGQRRYPIAYDLRSMGLYLLLAAVLYAAMRGLALTDLPEVVRLAANTALLAVFVGYIVRRDLPLSALPVVGKYFAQGGKGRRA